MVEHVQSQRFDSRTIAYAVAGIVFSLIAIVAALAFLYRGTISIPLSAAQSFPAPSVLTDEHTQRLKLESQQNDRLAGKTGGVPIGKAMDMIVSRSSHAFDPVTEAAP